MTNFETQVLAVGEVRTLGVPTDQATVWIGEAESPRDSWAGSRLLHLMDEGAYALSFHCGTCAFLFQRQGGANQTVNVPELDASLRNGLSGLDDLVISMFGELLGEGSYLPLLLRIKPRLVRPGDAADYFAHEQVATWGVNGFWALPENPRTPYYRTFEAPVSEEAHLYEFVAPMVPWTDPERVAEYVGQLEAGARPTAVALSTLDVCAPATNSSDDYYEHFGLTHFLLDGHHKMAAAVQSRQPITLLSLLSLEDSLASREQIARALRVRAGTEERRGASSPRSHSDRTSEASRVEVNVDYGVISGGLVRIDVQAGARNIDAFGWTDLALLPVEADALATNLREQARRARSLDPGLNAQDA